MIPFEDLFSGTHVVLVAFPTAGVIFSLLLALIALALGIYLDFTKDKGSKANITQQNSLLDYIQKFEFSSWILLVFSYLSITVVAYAGYVDANGFQFIDGNSYLTYKLQLTFYLLSILISPIIQKGYLKWKYNRNVFEISRLMPVIYILPIFIGTCLIILIAGAGSSFANGYTVLEKVNLDFLVRGVNVEGSIYSFILIQMGLALLLCVLLLFVSIRMTRYLVEVNIDERGNRYPYAVNREVDDLNT